MEKGQNRRRACKHIFYALLTPLQDLLVREGMAWIDDQSETKERAYWFPSLMGGSLQEN